MANDFLFSSLGNAVLVGWLCIFATLFLSRETRVGRLLYFVGGLVIPAALATLPVWHLVLHKEPTTGDLFSLSGIEMRFSDIDVLFLLYFEALTFSLFVGGLITQDREAKRIPRSITAIALLVLFFKGPLGALFYGLVSWIIVQVRQRPPRGI